MIEAFVHDGLDGVVVLISDGRLHLGVLFSELLHIAFEGAAEVLVSGKSRRREAGEILFTDYGLSGPPILLLSRIVSESVGKNREVYVALDLFPKFSQQELLDNINKRVKFDSKKTLEFSFVGLINKRLIPVVLKESGIEDIQQECGKLPKDRVEDLAAFLKRWPLKCTGTQSWMFSQVTAGGVYVNEVNEHTMESLIAKGVFFAGEVLDIDADSGGYNLQWAWSSGYVAGLNAAR